MTRARRIGGAGGACGRRGEAAEVAQTGFAHHGQIQVGLRLRHAGRRQHLGRQGSRQAERTRYRYHRPDGTWGYDTIVYDLPPSQRGDDDVENPEDY